MSSSDVARYDPADHDPVAELSPRLAIGVAAWRAPEAVVKAVRGWVEGSLASADTDGHAVFVAKLDGRVAGFVTVEERRHWAGDQEAYVGELVTAEGLEGRGVGRALMAAVERWAGARGLGYVTLDTGAANHRARRFYRGLGYLEESVFLTKPL